MNILYGYNRKVKKKNFKPAITSLSPSAVDKKIFHIP